MTISENSKQSHDGSEVKSFLASESATNLTSELNSQSLEIRESHNISLYSEKLNIDRRHRKLGEVVIRKQTETQMVQVPVRREKLIIECVGENPQELANVVIKEDKVDGFTLEELGENTTLNITKSHFVTIENAQKLLQEIANSSSENNTKIRLEIVTNSSEEQIKQQSVCDRYQ